MSSSLIKFLILSIFFSCQGCSGEMVDEGSRRVYIHKNGEHFTLIRNGTPFTIRGVAGQDSLSLVAKIGGNTVRTYDTLDLEETLNKAGQYGIAVIAGLHLPKSNEDWFYGNDSLIDQYEAGIRRLAEKYKDHPALLLWCLGNEPVFYNFADFKFSNAYNRFLKALHEVDPDHPVAMAMANFSDRAILNLRFKVSDIDLLLINTFGRLPILESDMHRYQWLWDGPFIIGEYGVNGSWETSTTVWGAPLEPNDHQKAERLKQVYRMLPENNPRFLGALAFYWGHRQEVTHTWFNFFSDTGEINESLYTLADLWGQPLTGNQPPVIQELQVDGNVESNHFLFRPNSTHMARVRLYDPDGDSLHFEWSIRAEDWFFKEKKTPEPLSNSFSSHSSMATVQFYAPAKPGPFRLFIKATDGHGHFATSNLPFYVVQ